MNNKRKATGYEFYMYITICKYLAGEITYEESKRRIAKIQKLKDEGKFFHKERKVKLKSYEYY